MGSDERADGLAIVRCGSVAPVAHGVPGPCVREANHLGMHRDFRGCPWVVGREFTLAPPGVEVPDPTSELARLLADERTAHATTREHRDRALSVAQKYRTEATLLADRLAAVAMTGTDPGAVQGSGGGGGDRAEEAVVVAVATIETLARLALALAQPTAEPHSPTPLGLASLVRFRATRLIHMLGGTVHPAPPTPTPQGPGT